MIQEQDQGTVALDESYAAGDESYDYGYEGYDDGSGMVDPNTGMPYADAGSDKGGLIFSFDKYFFFDNFVKYQTLL